MKAFLMSAAALAAAAGVAHADYTFNLGNALLGAGQTTSMSDLLTGTCTGVSISVDFQPDAAAQSAGSWCSDGAVFVGGPAGAISQIGGFNIFVGGATVFEGFWSYDGSGSAAPGVYTDNNRPVANPALTGAGLWTVGFGNGWSGSPPVQYNNITVTLHGVNAIPAPGAAALLGLGGLLAARRRR